MNAPTRAHPAPTIMNAQMTHRRNDTDFIFTRGLLERDRDAALQHATTHEAREATKSLHAKAEAAVNDWEQCERDRQGWRAKTLEYLNERNAARWEADRLREENGRLRGGGTG